LRLWVGGRFDTAAAGSMEAIAAQGEVRVTGFPGVLREYSS